MLWIFLFVCLFWDMKNIYQKLKMVGTVKLKKYENAQTTATAVSGDFSLWLPALDEQSE